MTLNKKKEQLDKINNENKQEIEMKIIYDKNIITSAITDKNMLNKDKGNLDKF